MIDVVREQRIQIGIRDSGRCALREDDRLPREREGGIDSDLRIRRYFAFKERGTKQKRRDGK